MPTSNSNSFLNFEELPTEAARRTKIWRVSSRTTSIVLGFVRWFPHWRKYTFIPEAGMVFDASCLHELSDFVLERTRDHQSANAFPERERKA